MTDKREVLIDIVCNFCLIKKRRRFNLLKPIGIVNRINYLLKTPHLKGIDLKRVKLNGKPASTAQRYNENYEIYRNYQMFSRQLSGGRDAYSTTIWSYDINKEGLVKGLKLESKEINNRYGRILYRSNDVVEVNNNRNTFCEKTHLKNLADDANLSSLPPKEQVRIKMIKRYIQLIKLNPSYEKYDEAFSKIILGR